eukprot:7252307-Pyramimonas_sp.AAC.1
MARAHNCTSAARRHAKDEGAGPQSGVSLSNLVREGGMSGMKEQDLRVSVNLTSEWGEGEGHVCGHDLRVCVNLTSERISPQSESDLR